MDSGYTGLWKISLTIEKRRRSIRSRLSLNNEYRSLLFDIDIQFLVCLTIMGVRYGTTICLISMLSFGLCSVGCSKLKQSSEGPGELAPKVDLGTTIGSIAEVFSLDAIAVEGYGLVGGLKGTGSAECPSHIRTYLEQYVRARLPKHGEAEKIINSRDTAVVLVQGVMPAAISKSRSFDVIVAALPGTQISSLEGGFLYGCDLKMKVGYDRSVRVLATTEGPVFIDTIDTSEISKKIGYILGGGRVLDEYKIRIGLREPNYKISNLIRNRLNERFEYNTATAVSSGVVELKVPAKYARQKQRFISLIKTVYLVEGPEIIQERINTFIIKLAGSEDKYASEIALEAIGSEGLGKLRALLNSSNQEVRLRAARCMLNLGSEGGLESLREIAFNKDSTYRIAALEAIGTGTNQSEIAFVSKRLLHDENFDIRLAAYEQLRRLDDIAITQSLIGGNFYLEQISQTEHKSIFVSRSGQPRIVLFGAPISCGSNIFIQSANGDIIINAPAGEEEVSLIRKHPTRPNVIARLKSSYKLDDIIRTLCEDTIVDAASGVRPGLGISYADAIALLKQMCDKGAVAAEFRAGPLPNIPIIIKK